MKKNRINNILYALLLALFSVSTVAHAQNIIPKPRKAQMNDGAFNINSRTRVVVADSNPLFMEIAEDFAKCTAVYRKENKENGISFKCN